MDERTDGAILLPTILTGTQGKTRHADHGSGVIETPAFMPVGIVRACQGIGSGRSRAARLPADAEQRVPPVPAARAQGGGRDGRPASRSPAGLARFSPTAAGFKCSVWRSSARITDDGVTFQSHLDGSTHFISPETAIEIRGSAGRRHHHGVRSMRGVAGGPTMRFARRSGGRSCGPPVARPAGAGRIRRCSASSRADWTRICGCSRREISSGWDSTVMRSADYPSVKARRTCMHAGGHGAGTAGRQAALSDGRRHAGRSDRRRGSRHRMFDCVVPSRHGRTGWLFTSTGRVLIKQAQISAR